MDNAHLKTCWAQSPGRSYGDGGVLQVVSCPASPELPRPARSWGSGPVRALKSRKQCFMRSLTSYRNLPEPKVLDEVTVKRVRRRAKVALNRQILLGLPGADDQDQ